MQVIIICDRTHGDAEKYDAREPTDGPPCPKLGLFDNGRGKAHAAPGQTGDTNQLGVPRHKIEMTFSPNFAPETDDGDQCDQEFHGIGQAQP